MGNVALGRHKQVMPRLWGASPAPETRGVRSMVQLGEGTGWAPGAGRMCPLSLNLVNHPRSCWEKWLQGCPDARTSTCEHPGVWLGEALGG